MATWPAIMTPSTITERLQKNQIKTDFSAGYVLSRPKWTRSRKTFELSWPTMIDADKQTLQTFFNDNLGDTFTWTHPLTAAVYTVRFGDDELSFEYVPVDLWQIRVALEEQ